MNLLTHSCGIEPYSCACLATPTILNLARSCRALGPNLHIPQGRNTIGDVSANACGSRKMKLKWYHMNLDSSGGCEHILTGDCGTISLLAKTRLVKRLVNEAEVRS
jgi:hypothetical protein